MTEHEFLRHVLATLAYRAGKCLRGAPADFPEFEGGNNTPLKLVAHLADLLEWALSMARGQGRWKADPPRGWDAECARFYQALADLDERLASGHPLPAEWTRLFQGPLADALTHAGQLAMLRRMAGSPVSGENYFVADIQVGRVGPDQAAPRKTF